MSPRKPNSLFQLFSASRSSPEVFELDPKLSIFSAPLDGGVNPRWIPPNICKPKIFFENPMPGKRT